MFNNRKCKRCNEKISKKDNFCASCGVPLNSEDKSEDWGMLGKSDSFDQNTTNPPGPLGGKMLNNMLNGAIKMLEKEMQREMKEAEKKKSQNNPPVQNPGFKLRINGQEVDFSNPEGQKQQKPKKESFGRNEFNKEQIKKYSKLPKEEPQADLKRFGNKIVYEINMPDVKSPNDIITNKLENSIEIKAVGKKKGYSKRIPISIPITKKRLSDGKLILEMEENQQQ